MFFVNKSGLPNSGMNTYALTIKANAAAAINSGAMGLAPPPAPELPRLIDGAKASSSSSISIDDELRLSGLDIRLSLDLLRRSCGPNNSSSSSSPLPLLPSSLEPRIPFLTPLSLSETALGLGAGLGAGWTDWGAGAGIGAGTGAGIDTGAALLVETP